MPEGFRTLAELLRAHREDAQDPVVQAAEPLEEDEAIADGEIEELMRDVRLFRARVAERFESALDALLADVATGVLARELQLAPAAVEAIVADALERFAAEEPLRVRLHPADAAQVTCAVPVVCDASLRQGDAVLEVRDGMVDSSLGVRLADVLAGIRP